MLITSRGRILSCDKPIIMGVLNVTPDSFFEGSRINDDKKLLSQASKMLEEGASILDVGGVSTRPGSVAPKLNEEIRRVSGALRILRREFPDAWLSVDSYRHEVVSEAYNEGVDMINDISAGSMDDKMLNAVSDIGLPYVLMHMKGSPRTMQNNPEYDNVVLDQLSWFMERLARLKEADILDVIIDPGFGFGKTVVDNYTILRHLRSYEIFQRPIMVGISRKSMLYKPLHKIPDQALSATIAAHTLALHNGAKILRVHDVEAAYDAIEIYTLYDND